MILKSTTTEKETKETKVGGEINYYVIAFIFIAVVVFDIANAIEPQIDSELDFFELAKMLEFSLQARC